MLSYAPKKWVQRHAGGKPLTQNHKKIAPPVSRLQTPFPKPCHAHHMIMTRIEDQWLSPSPTEAGEYQSIFALSGLKFRPSFGFRISAFGFTLRSLLLNVRLLLSFAYSAYFAVKFFGFRPSFGFRISAFGFTLRYLLLNVRLLLWFAYSAYFAVEFFGFRPSFGLRPSDLPSVTLNNT
jgi:hypothetical protein